MECFVYILRNKQNKYYTGITRLHPWKRLARHNKGQVWSTKFGMPWEIIHIERYNNYGEAREREKLIKSWHSGYTFKKLLAKAAGSSNGRTHASGAWYRGSNPCPAVKSSAAMPLM